MSDSLPSSCPRGLFSLLFSLAFTVFSITPAVANNNDPNPPVTTSEQLMQLREFIAGYAQNFVGIEYRHGGNSTETGFDCSGFTSFALNEFGIKVSACSSTQATQGDEVSLDAVKPGDLIFFGRKGRIKHVALVVRNTEEGIICVHSTCSKGIMVENISTSKYWKPKIMFARDVVSTQALEKCLLPLPGECEQQNDLFSTAPTSEQMPDCIEESQENICQSIAPLAMLDAPDLAALQLFNCGSVIRGLH